MSRKAMLGVSPLALALAVSLVGSGPVDRITEGADAAAAVGAPWMSVEMPANPMDPTTRGAALLVHVYHHQRAVGFPVTGTAEGLVDGERRTIPLEFRRASGDGVYAVSQQWPSKGDWVLNLTANGGSAVSLIVELGPDGGLKGARYYGMEAPVISARSIRVVEGTVNTAQIEATLRRLASRSD